MPEQLEIADLDNKINQNNKENVDNNDINKMEEEQ